MLLTEKNKNSSTGAKQPHAAAQARDCLTRRSCAGKNLGDASNVTKITFVFELRLILSVKRQKESVCNVNAGRREMGYEINRTEQLENHYSYLV